VAALVGVTVDPGWFDGLMGFLPVLLPLCIASALVLYIVKAA
jgi:hypothetical protein